jgi:hypothetical protein
MGIRFKRTNDAESEKVVRVRSFIDVGHIGL